MDVSLEHAILSIVLLLACLFVMFSLYTRSVCVWTVRMPPQIIQPLVSATKFYSPNGTMMLMCNATGRPKPTWVLNWRGPQTKKRYWRYRLNGINNHNHKNNNLIAVHGLIVETDWITSFWSTLKTLFHWSSQFSFPLVNTCNLRHCNSLRSTWLFIVFFVDLFWYSCLPFCTYFL